MILYILLGISVFALSSCSDNSSPTNPSASGAGASMTMMSTSSAASNGGVIVVTRAKFLIEFIKLEIERGHDDADLKIGPFVADVALNTMPTPIVLNSIPAGTFTEVHIKIHKHVPNEVVIDPDFGLINEVGFSGVISGTYNGIPFVYKTAITESEEIDLDPPVVVSPKGSFVNITLMVDPSSWFLNGSVTLDPNDPANRDMIDHEIKQSFKRAFRDDDHDGHPDHEHGG